MAEIADDQVNFVNRYVEKLKSSVSSAVNENIVLQTRIDLLETDKNSLLNMVSTLSARIDELEAELAPAPVEVVAESNPED